MQSLDDKMWEPISIGKQFNLCRGRESKSTVEEGGVLPFVSAKKTDNGYRMFVKTSKTKIDGNTLSLNNNGDGGAGFGYYQPHEYTVDVNTTALIPHQNVPFDCYIGLFWTGCFTWMHEYFGNARTLSNKRAEMTKIMLPVDDAGEPDYEYMAEYTRQKHEAMLEKYREYAKARVAELGDIVDVPALDEKEWAEFRIGELFEVSRPAARNKDNYQVGGVPFVASGSVNNGVMKLCEPLVDEPLDKGGCITVSPVDGSTFFQPMDFLGRGGAGSSILMLRSADLNLYRGQFMARAIEQTCSKYTYGHMGNKDSIKRERIMLPVDDTGEPDYAYMEQYAKNMMLRKYRQYFSFLERDAEE